MYPAVVIGPFSSSFAAEAVGTNSLYVEKKASLAKLTYIDFILASWLCLTAAPKRNETLLDLFS